MTIPTHSGESDDVVVNDLHCTSLSGDHVMTTISGAIAETRVFLQQRSDRGPVADMPVRETVDAGLRCSFTDGNQIHATDMPLTLGGTASAPTPGHYVREAIAACAATAVAMHAAELDIELETISATAASTSDAHAFLGLREVVVGLLDLAITVEVLPDFDERHRRVQDKLYRVVADAMTSGIDPSA